MDRHAREMECPAWCAGEHHDQERLDDQWHRSSAVAVPVMERGKTARDTSVTAVELEVFLEQHVLDDVSWVTFGAGDDVQRCSTISRESPERLTRSLTQAVRLRGGPRTA